MRRDGDWLSRLESIFAADVNQNTLEEAADDMAELSKDDDIIRDAYIDTLNRASAAGAGGDDRIVHAVAASGYKVSSIDRAIKIIDDLKNEYIKRLNEN